ncbi:hypothetical protein BDK51DRAFT_44461 [Blyttiomyces helicus]|uniref:Uncharacterized protein n=1 Tax=Blyttiomyces helicus TaxID=388810 RepID=A0A4P9VYE8_9FUNG|nr:hypothetical protein BDK51DRAFT_44461 [Blyttiomyces helicus]|eukprot:RKO83328.1 hypothetical protein BDK51DRAFT_44461 [Blyttiomyces helicus]
MADRHPKTQLSVDSGESPLRNAGSTFAAVSEAQPAEQTTGSARRPSPRLPLEIVRAILRPRTRNSPFPDLDERKQLLSCSLVSSLWATAATEALWERVRYHNPFRFERFVAASWARAGAAGRVRYLRLNIKERGWTPQRLDAAISLVGQMVGLRTLYLTLDWGEDWSVQGELVSAALTRCPELVALSLGCGNDLRLGLEMPHEVLLNDAEAAAIARGFARLQRLDLRDSPGSQSQFGTFINRVGSALQNQVPSSTSSTNATIADEVSSMDDLQVPYDLLGSEFIAGLAFRTIRELVLKELPENALSDAFRALEAHPPLISLSLVGTRNLPFDLLAQFLASNGAELRVLDISCTFPDLDVLAAANIQAPRLEELVIRSHRPKRALSVANVAFLEKLKETNPRLCRAVFLNPRDLIVTSPGDMIRIPHGGTAIFVPRQARALLDGLDLDFSHAKSDSMLSVDFEHFMW